MHTEKRDDGGFFGSFKLFIYTTKISTCYYSQYVGQCMCNCAYITGVYHFIPL